MLSALLLSMPALTGNVSVLSSNPDEPAESSTTNDNTAPADANANTAVPADTNSNSGLIENPATDQFEKEAANAEAANSVPANAAAGSTSNKGPAKGPAKPKK